MDSRLFQIDPYAGISYGLYNSLKGDKGSFEDFLLHYDSTGANKEDNTWLTKLVKDDSTKALPRSVGSDEFTRSEWAESC